MGCTFHPGLGLEIARGAEQGRAPQHGLVLLPSQPSGVGVGLQNPARGSAQLDRGRSVGP